MPSLALPHGPFRYKIAALWNGVERLPVASGSAGVDHVIDYLFDVRLAFFCLFCRARFWLAWLPPGLQSS
jgi:hypothetical protein